MALGLQSRKRLNDGVEIPVLGLGVYQAPPGRTTQEAVKFALKLGYRLIDTASLYGNERDVGMAVRESGIPREEIFVTTKLWNSEQGYERTIRAFEHSLKLLGLDYIDLYLIHWPVPGAEERKLASDREGAQRRQMSLHRCQQLYDHSPKRSSPVFVNGPLGGSGGIQSLPLSERTARVQYGEWYPVGGVQSTGTGPPAP